MSFLPEANWDVARNVPGRASSRTLSRTGARTAQERQLTLAAENALIKVLYGPNLIGADVLNVQQYGLYWYIQCQWGEGEIEAVDKIFLKDGKEVGAADCHHYTGTAGQGVDSWMQMAFAANGVTYTDTLPNIAYSVIRVPVADGDLTLDIVAKLRGLKVHDPRENLLVRSDEFGNVSWSKTGGTATADTSVLAPDGTATVNRINSSSAGQITQATTATSTSHVFSLYVKNNGGAATTTFYLRNTTTATNLVSATLTWATMAIGGGASIESVGDDGWYRIALAASTGISVGNTLTCYAGSWSGSGQNYFVWRAQLNSGVTTIGSTKTTAAAVVPVTAYSDNPSLCMRDFVRSTRYGKGGTTNDHWLALCANANDELVSGEKRRRMGLAIDVVATVDEWIETLASYAAVFINKEGGEYVFIPDRPAASVFHFDHNAGNILKLGDPQRRKWSNAPTVTSIRWTDTSTEYRWRDKLATHIPDAVQNGFVPYQDVVVPMPGIQWASQAHREKVERHNKTSVSDLSLNLWTQDVGIQFRNGNVVEVSHPFGFGNKKFRVTNVAGQFGRYVLALSEYDPAQYSDSVVTEGTTPDTVLPNPAAPQPVTGLTLTEEVFQLRDGSHSSRIRATWTAPATFPTSFIEEYRINVRAAGTLIDTGTSEKTEVTFVTGAVQENVTYQVDVIVVSRLGQSSDVVSATKTALGKFLIPGDVSVFTGYEIGGEVRLFWNAAIDKDIRWYEVRYNTVGGGWATSLLIDRIDALRITTKDIPSGTWEFYIKAIDSVEQYSTNAAVVTITVTSDANAFLVDSATFESPTLTNMTEYSLDRTDPNRYFVTDDGVAFDTKFASNLDTYTNPLFSYATAASSWVSETEPFDTTISGNWRGELPVTAITGTFTKSLGVSLDGSVWQTYGAMTAKTQGRFARVRADAASGSVMLVTIPGATVKIDAVTRDESGIVTTLSSGGKLIQLTGEYTAVKSLQTSPVSTTAKTASWNRLIVAPVTGLAFELTSTWTTGVGYGFNRISTASRTILSDDYLEYDVYVTKNGNNVVRRIGGFDINFTDATNLRDIGASCANGTGNSYSASTLPTGEWVSRKIPLTVAAGKSANSWQVTAQVDGTGEMQAVYKNIRVTNGAGVTRQTIWTADEPTTNVVTLSSMTTNIECGPSNTFMAYCHTDAGTQVANDISYFFKGV